MLGGGLKHNHLLVLIFIISNACVGQLSHAWEPTAGDWAPEAGDSVDTSEVITYEVEPKYEASSYQVPTSGNYKSPPLTRHFHENCHKDYIRPDGSYGWKAQLIAKELTGQGYSNNYSDYFFGPPLPKMEIICPNIDSFWHDHTKKLNFWIWYMTSLAQKESKCGFDPMNWADVNGISAGDFQMPEEENGETAHWRGKGCTLENKSIVARNKVTRKNQAVRLLNPHNNIPCAVEVLGGVLCGKYRVRGKHSCRGRYPIYGHGFWAELKRKSGGKIMKNVKRFPLCH